jgi:hypothetical protein
MDEDVFKNAFRDFSSNLILSFPSDFLPECLIHIIINCAFDEEMLIYHCLVEKPISFSWKRGSTAHVWNVDCCHINLRLAIISHIIAETQTNCLHLFFPVSNLVDRLSRPSLMCSLNHVLGVKFIQNASGGYSRLRTDETFPNWIVRETHGVLQVNCRSLTVCP